MSGPGSSAAVAPPSDTRFSGTTVQVSRSGPGYTEKLSQSPSYGCASGGGRRTWKCAGSGVSRAERRWSSQAGWFSQGTASHSDRPSSPPGATPSRWVARGLA